MEASSADTNDQESQSAQASPSSKDGPRSVALIALIGSVVAALIAIGGVVVGAKMTGHYALESQEKQIQEERAKLAREKRTSVYLTFMSRSRTFIETVRHLGINPSANIDEYFALKVKQKRSLDSIERQWPGLSESLDEVSIYGSDEAFETARDLVAQLGFFQLEPGGVPPDINFALEEQEKFMRVMCRELSPTPRKRCNAQGS